MPKAVIFDVDGTLVDSVDLHAVAWQEALRHFGHNVTFEQVRTQIGKGGDQLISVFLAESEQKDHGKKMEEWRSELFKSKYQPLVRPFSAVPELLQRVREGGLKVAVASSAKANELEAYLEIARVRNLVSVAISSDDADRSKPAPDMYEVTLKKLCMESSDVIAVGDTPYDAEAAGRAGIPAIGFLSGGFSESDLRKAGCIAVYPGPASLLACFDASPFAEGWEELSGSVTHGIEKFDAMGGPAGAVQPCSGEPDRRSASLADASRSNTKKADPVVQEIYRSSNGDRWQLIRDESGRRIIRHEANASSGGQVTDTEINVFLRVPGSGPEMEELRRMLRDEEKASPSV